MPVYLHCTTSLSRNALRSKFATTHTARTPSCPVQSTSKELTSSICFDSGVPAICYKYRVAEPDSAIFSILARFK